MMNIKLKMYDEVKYSPLSKKVAEVECNNIRGFKVVTGTEATTIGEETDVNSRD